MVEARTKWERQEAIRLNDRRELLRAFATHVRDCPPLFDIGEVSEWKGV
jgi:hypothetical protein